MLQPLSGRLDFSVFLLAVMLFLFDVSSVRAQTNGSEKSSSAPAVAVNQAMSRIGQVFVDAFPLIIAERELTEKESKQLVASLELLSKWFKSVESHMKRRSDAYQIGYEFITEYLKITRQLFHNNDRDYGRVHLYALGEICSTCHTQDNHLRTLFSGAARDRFDSDYAYAEFNYVTRNYKDALVFYERFLLDPGAKTELQVIQPLQRMLTVYIQVYNKPDQAIEVLRKFSKVRGHTSATREELDGWVKGLETLVKDNAAGVKEPDYKSLRQYVVKYFGRTEQIPIDIESTAEEEVQRVWLRGQLFHYLNNAPDPDTVPKILYWLSVSDRSIAYNFYFSLADLFLKQCVLSYTQHPFARQCFKEYQAYIEYHYGREGKSGYPEEIQQELNQLRAALKSVQ